MKIHIQHGQLINPATEQDTLADVFIENQLVVAVGDRPPGFIADRIIEARNKLVMPGVVDIQCRVRDPGFTENDAVGSDDLLLAPPSGAQWRATSPSPTAAHCSW